MAFSWPVRAAILKVWTESQFVEVGWDFVVLFIGFIGVLGNAA